MSQRVVFIADHIAHWNAGTERQLLLLGTELKKRGWQVPLYVFKRSDSLVDGRWPDEVTNLDCEQISSPFTWTKLLRTGRREKKQGAQVVHCFFNDSSMIVPPIFSIAGLNSIVSRRDMGFWYTRANLAVLRFTRRFVSLVVANSRAVAANVQESEGYAPDAVSVIYNGLVEEQVRERGDDDGHIVIGIVANIRKVKRIDDAIRAFARVAEDYPKTALRVVGGGDTTELEALAESLGVRTRIQFAGRTDDPASEIATFSIALSTSESEGFSNSIVEYMQAGIPVVCTDTGGNPELISHGESGLVAPVGDDEAIAACLTTLVGDGDARLRMGEAGRKFVRQICSTEKMVDAHESIYGALAA